MRREDAIHVDDICFSATPLLFGHPGPVHLRLAPSPGRVALPPRVYSLVTIADGLFFSYLLSPHLGETTLLRQYQRRMQGKAQGGF